MPFHAFILIHFMLPAFCCSAIISSEAAEGIEILPGVQELLQRLQVRGEIFFGA